MASGLRAHFGHNILGVDAPNKNSVGWVLNVSTLICVRGGDCELLSIWRKSKCCHRCRIPAELAYTLLTLAVPDINHAIAPSCCKSSVDRMEGDRVYRVNALGSLDDSTVTLESIPPRLRTQRCVSTQLVRCCKRGLSRSGRLTCTWGAGST